MKMCLPIEEPPITSFPVIANILSILWGSKEKVIPWLSDRFIQLVIRPNFDPTIADFYDHADLDNFISLIYGCPFLGWMRNNRITANFTKFTDYIIYQINQGYYLEPCLDNYYFKFTNHYQKKHHIHPTLIYGYDNDNEQVYIADFFDGKRYTREVVSYEEINKSIENVDYFINLYKLQDAQYKFNPELMNTYLYDYMNSKDSLHKFGFSCPEYNKNVLFGLDYYDFVISNICNIYKSIDIRPFHILFDHKRLMKIRLEFLYSQKIYDNYKIKDLILKNDELIYKSNILRNLAIKYNIRNDIETMQIIKDKCNKLKSLDYALVSDILATVSKDGFCPSVLLTTEDTDQ